MRNGPQRRIQRQRKWRAAHAGRKEIGCLRHDRQEHPASAKPDRPEDDVEVSALFARDFHGDHLCRWTIELCRREYLAKAGNVPLIQHHDQNYTIGQARFSINDDRHAPADHIGYAQRVQPLCEHQKEVSFGHTRKSCERLDGWLRRSNRGAPRATRPPLVAGRNNTAVRPPAISGPATLLATPFALRFPSGCASVSIRATDCNCFSQNAKKKQIPRANPALGMTINTTLSAICR